MDANLELSAVIIEMLVLPIAVPLIGGDSERSDAAVTGWVSVQKPQVMSSPNPQVSTESARYEKVPIFIERDSLKNTETRDV